MAPEPLSSSAENPLITPALPRASTASVPLSALLLRGAVSFTSLNSASVMSLLAQRLPTTPCDPVLTELDAALLLRAGPLAVAVLVDADRSPVSCWGATPWLLALSKRGWLP